MWVKCYKSKSEWYKVIYVETVPYTNVFIMRMVYYSSSRAEFYGGHCRHGPSKYRVSWKMKKKKRVHFGDFLVLASEVNCHKIFNET